jgi:hypothetical protein
MGRESMDFNELIRKKTEESLDRLKKRHERHQERLGNMGSTREFLTRPVEELTEDTEEQNKVMEIRAQLADDLEKEADDAKKRILESKATVKIEQLLGV